MTRSRLLLRNLFFHWRGNLAVLLGVAVATAVLTGALLVGDSLRGSLRALTLDQLGWVDQALVAGRFFREELASGLDAQRTSPAILLQGTAAIRRKDEEKTKVRNAGKVTVLGVDQRFWPADHAWADPDLWKEGKAEVVLNAALAESLLAKVGDEIILNVQKTDNIPRESLFGKRKTQDVVKPLTVTVRQILPDEGMGRFSLKPGPDAVRNAFVPLLFLQDKLELPRRVNALLVGGGNESLAAELQKHLTLDDWNLRLRSPEDRARNLVKFLDPRNRDGRLRRFRWQGRVPEELAAKANSKGELTLDQVIDYYRKHRAYLSLESGQVFLEPAVAQAVQTAWGANNWSYERALVYLADTLSDGEHEAPYVIVAAVAGPDIAELKPLGYPLKDEEIALANWPGSPLRAKEKDKISVTYYVADDQGQLTKKEKSFVVARLISLKGTSDDPDITPQFPGITDKLDMGSWEKPPFPYVPKRIKPADEAFWKRYRTTPRAYVNLATAQKLWGSRFGQLTSIRILLGDKNSALAAKEFSDALLTELKPEHGGFVFQDVKKQGLQAGAGSTDFGGLFLGFSIFLIAAALLLVGLLFRLNLDRRAPEIGLLLATGFPRRNVRRLFLGEGAVLAVLGGLVGTGGAVLYARLLLNFLSANWPGGQRLTFLHFHGSPTSFLIGFLGALAASLITVFWATRVLARVAPKGLLAGETTSPEPITGAQGKKGRTSVWIACSSGLGALVFLFLGVVTSGHHGHEVPIGFFDSGALSLIALLAAVWAWMLGTRHHRIVLGNRALIWLGVRNAARHPVRSLLTAGLLASATFLVVAVQSFHRQAGPKFFEKTGGSGGFALLAEADVPIFQDLNSAAARADFFAPEEVPASFKEAVFYPFRVRAGDDASCLNLYQPLRPRIMGVPQSLIHRGGFHFRGGLWRTQEEGENPWRILNRTEEDGAIPVFADANTAEWILHVGLGDMLEVPDEQGNKQKLRIAGLLQESIFQSELLMADANFKKLFPRQEGFGFFLIQCPPPESEKIKSDLETASSNPGLFVQATAKRLDAYLAVENTYLATFQALGGLGLLLGALGLAVVLLRSVWERRGELALLRALGFRRRALGWLVLAENGFLLVLGLGVGTVSALLAVAPHLIGSGGGVLWLQLIGLLALVLLVGLGAAMAAVAATLRAPLLTALRRE